MEVPDALVDYATFIFIGMKKSSMWGLHGHGFSCEKGKKGKFLCCLVFKQEIHKEKTCVFIIIYPQLRRAP
jgi:hypothetical protein